MSYRELTVGVFYHVFNRGFLKMNIFENFMDRERFIKKAFCLARIYNIEISSYALMKNHFHFLLKQNGGTVFISIFMQRLGQSFASYFNLKYKRRGPVFDSRFKSKLVADNKYFEDLQKYIAFNPIKGAKIDSKNGRSVVKNVFT